MIRAVFHLASEAHWVARQAPEAARPSCVSSRTSAQVGRGRPRRLGLRPGWIQDEGTHREHFDVTDTVRKQALEFGAAPLSYPRETGRHLADKREIYGRFGGAA